MVTLKGNVIKRNDFREIMDSVLAYVSNAVSETFGPHGHNALIQTADTVYSTKDGFHTLQNIDCGDSVKNSIKFLIESVAQSIVLSVGDGSTTSIVAASYLNKLLQDNRLTSNYTIKQIENSLTNTVNALTAKLYDNATSITDENMYDSIKKIALVSTNWDEDLSTMIADIYEKTHNPIIKIEDSGTDKTFVEYIEGYDLAGSLFLKEYYANDREHNRADLNNPVIIVFNHNVQAKYFLSLSCLAQIYSVMNRPLVIMAPGFDTTFVSKLSATNAAQIKAHKPIINMILCNIINYYSIDRDCIRDFCTLIGCKPVSVDDDDFNEMMDDLATTMLKDTSGLSKEDIDKINLEKEAISQLAIQYILDNIAGTCEKMIAGEKSIIAKGLPNKDLPIIEDIKQSIRTEIDYKIKECDAKTILTDDIRMKRVRLAKLSCIMGIIKVGGYGSANIKAKKDALDDATRACEAAYRDGYTMGSSLSIMKAAKEIIIDEENNYSELDKIIARLIQNAFSGVFGLLFVNKYGSEITDDVAFEVSGDIIDASDNVVVDDEDDNTAIHMTISGIANKCIENNIGFDILTNTFDTDGKVINPVSVDVEALKACMRLVIISVTTSQFIYKNYDIDTGKDITMTEVQ